MKQDTSSLFSQTIADSRRPINEVDLWSWSSLVGALYKAALVGALLTESTPASNLRWRLLSVRINGLEFISNVSRIPDLLARLQIFANSLDKVRELLEVDYPLGSEVYSDGNGSVYIVPDVPNLLEITDKCGTALKTRINQAFAQGTVNSDPCLQLGEEIVPCLDLEQNSWWGQDPNWTDSSNDELPDIKGILCKPVRTQPMAGAVQKYWENKASKSVCPVCRLRPMGENKEVCEHCRKRRGSRVEEWLKHPEQTIWMDEIADHNDRVALLVGKFGLDDWLSGNLVQTLLVKAAENNPGGCVPKNPSPARLSRIWETAQRFWTDTSEQGILKQHEYAQSALRCARLRVIPDTTTDWQEKVPYDGTINSGAISLLWCGAEGHFITISNLQLAAGDAKSAEELAQAWKGHTVTLSDPDNPRRTHSLKVQEAKPAEGAIGRYVPYLRLLASPDQFLALVPATEALAVAQKIHEKYTKEFGKVQNRLPLYFGIVFFQRETPLMAVMDTARRMLNQVKFKEEIWHIETVNNGTLIFSNEIKWNIPTKMGDNSTCDVWYPYFFIEGDPGKRPLRFQNNGRWLVHVNSLQQGDTVWVLPSRFAYIYLEQTAQRFHFEPEKEVMLLDELPKLTNMWRDICSVKDMSDTKLRGVADLLHVKGEMWGRDSQAWMHLIQTTLKTAGMLQNGVVTIKDVTSGRFERCLDLHLRILKRRV